MFEGKISLSSVKSITNRFLKVTKWWMGNLKNTLLPVVAQVLLNPPKK